MTDNILPADKIPVTRVPAMPADLNEGGTVFGGWIMSQVDIAGSIPALHVPLTHLNLKNPCFRVIW